MWWFMDNWICGSLRRYSGAWRYFSLKGQCHKIFELYFFSLIEPIWALYKQAKIVFLKNSFSRRYSNLKLEKFDSAQANTARIKNF